MGVQLHATYAFIDTRSLLGAARIGLAVCLGMTYWNDRAEDAYMSKQAAEHHLKAAEYHATEAAKAHNKDYGHE